MSARLRTLRGLSAAFRGRVEDVTDWAAVVDMANASLVTPQLHAALLDAGQLDRLPPEIRRFTGEAFARNRQRNGRLFAQLRRAVQALNAAGIEPVLLKGAAVWASLGRPEPFDRMFNDLDLLVRPVEADLAVGALSIAGYSVLTRHYEPWRHVVAEMGSASDVGALDLHRRPPGPLKSATFPERGRRLEWDGVCAIVPEPSAQVFMLALHDQFHEGGYWRGDLSFRHLLDIAALAPEVDWAELDRIAGNRLVRRAVAVQVAAARRFAGARAPRSATRGAGVWLQHQRQLAQFGWPATVWPLACVAAVSEASSLLGRGRLVGDGPGGVADRLLRFRTLARPAARIGP